MQPSQKILPRARILEPIVWGRDIGIWPLRSAHLSKRRFFFSLSFCSQLSVGYSTRIGTPFCSILCRRIEPPSRWEKNARIQTFIPGSRNPYLPTPCSRRSDCWSPVPVIPETGLCLCGGAAPVLTVNSAAICILQRSKSHRLLVEMRNNNRRLSGATAGHASVAFLSQSKLKMSSTRTFSVTCGHGK